MFTRLLIATDLSPASFAVVNCLGGLRACGAVRCLLLQCLSVQEVSSTALSGCIDVLNEILKQQKEILVKQGFDVETRIVPGFAKYEINRLAQEENYSLIVVGSQGHSLVGEKILGGVAYEVIHSARIPVLVIPIEKKEGEGKVCIQAAGCDFNQHVLFPTDFSENADLAFIHVEKLVATGARKVTLLHVQDKARIEPHLKGRLEEFNRIDRVRLETMASTLRERGPVDIQVEVCYGSPFVEIVRFIRDENVGLVVMGSQGRGFVEELFLGSVSHNVARHSPAPVLLVPTQRK